MKIYFTQKARENLESLAPEIQKRIAKKMRFFAAQKNPLVFAKRLSDPREGQFRFRIGDYRVIFDVIRDTVFVLKIAPRDKAYE